MLNGWWTTCGEQIGQRRLVFGLYVPRSADTTRDITSHKSRSQFKEASSLHMSPPGIWESKEAALTDANVNALAAWVNTGFAGGAGGSTSKTAVTFRFVLCTRAGRERAILVCTYSWSNGVHVSD